MTQHLWTEREVEAAKRILAKHDDIGDALEEISATVRRCNYEALRGAFRTRELGPLRTYLARPGETERRHSREGVDLSSRDTERPEPLPRAKRVDDPTIDALLAAVKRGPVTLHDLCDALDVSPSRARALVERARGEGYRVDLDGDHVGVRPATARTDADHVVMPAGERQRFAVISDIHFGSTHHLGHYLEDFIDHVYALGVRVVLCPGDFLDGVYEHSVWEQDARGFKEQCDAAIRGLPQRPGMSFHAICGNHDETFAKKSGVDVGATIEQSFRAAGRHDLTFHGERGAYLRLASPTCKRGLIVELWHPLKGPAYALTYKMQKHVEAYAPGSKPDVLLVGHWHQAAFFTTRGVFAMSCGTFQGGGSSFGKALGGSPTIGGWVIEYAQTEHGTVRDFSPTWRAYYEREEVRDVGLG